MGFFSFKTADTKENIMNRFTDECREVYLLQPNGIGNICEPSYEGYGVFGGIDAFDWLVDMNVDKALIKRAEKADIEKRIVGIGMTGNYYIDSRTGKKYSYGLSELFDDILPFPGNYASEVDGVVINDLIELGIWEKKPMVELFGGIKYPLKFSFDKDAVYEDLEASEDADNQGYNFF